MSKKGSEPGYKLAISVCESRKIEALTKRDQSEVTLPAGTVHGLLYPWFLLLGVNSNMGVFEEDYVVIHKHIFTRMPEVTLDFIKSCIDAYEDVGLLMRYKDSEDRPLCALLRYQGWGNQARQEPTYEAPPGCHRNVGALFNVPIRGAGSEGRPAPVVSPHNVDSIDDGNMDAEGVEPVKPVVTDQPTLFAAPEPGGDPKIHKAKASADARKVIDFYRLVWKPPATAKPYSDTAMKAALRALNSGDADLSACKVVIWLAKFGHHGWYRENNHTMEYLLRGTTISKILTDGQRLNLALPAINAAAVEYGVLPDLLRMGFKGETGGSLRPNSSVPGRTAVAAGSFLQTEEAQRRRHEIGIISAREERKRKAQDDGDEATLAEIAAEEAREAAETAELRRVLQEKFREITKTA